MNLAKNIKQSGFSLIELLVFIGIFSFVVLILTDIFVATVDIKLESEATSAVVQDGRFILARLNFEFSNASLISAPLNPGDSQNVLTLMVAGQPVSYELVDGMIRLTDSLGEVNLNGSETEVSSLEFTKLGDGSINDTIRVSFTINSRVGRKQGPESQTFQTTLGIRK